MKANGFGSGLRALSLLGILASVPTPVSAQPSMLDKVVSDVATGGGFTCALTETSGVQCWGQNQHGQLGDGTTTSRSLPAGVSGLGFGVVSVVAGGAHACALTTSGGVKCWGWNVDAQLGDGTATQKTVPVDVNGLTSGVAAIAARGNHTCALTTSGGAKCWGLNSSGQLGDGTITQQHSPADVAGLTSGVLSLSLGEEHTCARTLEGGVKCWGNNVYGQLGDGTSVNRITAAEVSGLTSGVKGLSVGAYHTCALTTTGGVRCWGYNGYGQVGDGTTGFGQTTPTDVLGLTSEVAAVSAGETSTCALTTGGGMKCWGGNDYGNLGDGTTTNRPSPADVPGLTAGVARISAANAHACALSSTGGLKCWGYNGYGQVGNGTTALTQTTPSSVTRLSGEPATLSVGGEHTCGLTLAGAVTCWGRNSNGQLGDGTTTSRATPVPVLGLSSPVVGLNSPVTSLSSGMSHTCAVTATGGVKCWGSNGNGRLGNGSTIGQLIAVDVTGLSNGVVSVSAGGLHSCALTTQGGVKCWGSNFYGQLGDGTTLDRWTPVDVQGLASGVVGISTGTYHTCALTATGGAKCWGGNDDGALGDGTLVRKLAPTDVSGLSSGVAGISSGHLHTCALTTAGGAKCWGNNANGRLGDGTTVRRVTPVDVTGMTSGVAMVEAGGTLTCATTTGGAGKCWGLNNAGALGNGTTVSQSTPADVLGMASGVSSIASGSGHACALTVQREAMCWGPNGWGQVGDGTWVDQHAPAAVRRGQSILFTPVSGLSIGVPTSLTAVATGGLPVMFDTWTPDACTVDGNLNTVTATSTALCGIRVSRSGFVGLAAAPQILTLIVVPSGTVPDAPTIGTAMAGDGAVTVAFSAPSNNGGSAITGYTATCGASSGSGPGSPVLVSGLPNDVAVTCTVVATNYAGDSAPSEPSNSVTPQEGADVTLTLNLDGVDNGYGDVTAGPISCDNAFGGPRTCSFPYTPGTLVQLVAHSAWDSVFGGWTGACAHRGTNPTCDLTLTEDTVVGANYLGPQTLTIQVASLENGMGTVSGWVYRENGATPFSCEGLAGSTAACTVPVRIGGTVYVEMFSGALSVLNGVAGCSAVSNGPLHSFCSPDLTVLDDVTFSATFRGPQTLTIQVASVENGVGTVSGWVTDVGGYSSTPFTCDGLVGSTASCTVPARVGSAVFIDMFSGALSVLDGSVGCSVVDNGPLHSYCPSLTILDDATVSAAFRGPQTLTLQVASIENGIGTLSGWVTDVGGYSSTPFTCDGIVGSTASCTVPARVGSTVFLDMFSGALSVVDGVVGCSAMGNDPLHAYCPSLTILDDATVSATFRGPQALTVHVASVENGIGTVSGWVTDVGGYSSTPFTCDGLVGSTASCTVPARLGSTAFVEMFSGALSALDGVVGCTVLGNDPLHGYCPSVTMLDDATVSVTFRGPQTLGISFGGDGSGEVVVAPLGTCASSQGTCAYQLGLGSSQELVATPASDSLFQSWTGACAGQGAACVLNMGDDLATKAILVLRNHPPVAVAGGPYAGVRNQAISFSGAASTDPDSNALTFSWDFGDGSAAGSGVSPTHAYATTGAFTVTLTVNDGTVNSAPAASTVTISNQAPTANAGGPYSGTRLAPVVFSGAASADPEGDGLTYSWTFGDGGVGTGPAPTHLYTATGTFTVTLTVNDGTANSAPATTTAQVTNLAPTVAMTSPAPGAIFHAPALVPVSAAAADSDGGVTKVEFFAGAAKIGEALSAPFAINWPIAIPGTYALSAVVTDSSGATVASLPAAVVINAPPAVSLASPADNSQFASPANITITANALDPDGTVSQVEFFRGGTSLGVDASSPYSVTWNGAGVGSYAITAVATDNRGAVTSSVAITVKVTATLAMTADSYVRASPANSNYGTAAELTVQEGSSNSNIRWTYVKFDLTTVPTITNAKVRLFGAVSATTGTAINTAVYSVADTAWSENGIKWNNKPGTGATELSTVAIVTNSTTARWYEFDVTAYLQAEKAAGRNVVTLAFKNLANSTPHVEFVSRQGVAANRPQVLVVP